jgi:hypothetical protein
VRGDEFVIVEVGIRAVDPVDLRELSLREALARIEAPSTGHQSLSAQNLMNTGDAPGKAVGGIEESGVRVGELMCAHDPLRRDRARCAPSGDLVQQLDRTPRPDCPLTEQTAHEGRSAPIEPIPREQVEDDGVVVASVEGDLVCPAGLRETTNDVDRGVAVERSNLDCDNLLELGEPAPEVDVEAPAAGGRRGGLA